MGRDRADSTGQLRHGEAQDVYQEAGQLQTRRDQLPARRMEEREGSFRAAKTGRRRGQLLVYGKRWTLMGEQCPRY